MVLWQKWLTPPLPTTDLSSWQNVIGVFSFHRWMPNFPTQVGLIKHQVHPKSSTAESFTLFFLLGMNSLRGKVTSSTVCLPKRSHLWSQMAPGPLLVRLEFPPLVLPGCETTQPLRLSVWCHFCVEWLSQVFQLIGIWASKRGSLSSSQLRGAFFPTLETGGWSQ